MGEKNQLSYASLAAFLAHWRALRTAPARSEAEERMLAEMARLLAALTPDECAALDAHDAGAAHRHRERAEQRLRRELLSRGVLSG
jgi:hypothetical protein